MNELALPLTTTHGAQAWRFTFEDPGTERPALMVIREPRHVAVSARVIPVGDALDEAETGDDSSLAMIYLHPSDVPADLEQRVAHWVNRGEGYGPAVRANIRTNRVVWTGTRTLVYAAPDQWPDSLDAILRFTLMARDMTALENQIRFLWSALGSHVSLTHTVTFREERLQPRVNEMTEAVTRMRISYLQVRSAIEQTDPGLSSASKRLCAELLLQAGLYDRLEVVEEPIQFALDHYERANTRLIEHKHASIEIVLTGLIAIALIVQTAVIISQELFK